MKVKKTKEAREAEKRNNPGHLPKLSEMGKIEDDASTGTTQTNQEAHCCLNGQFFDCPSASASKTCFDDAEPGDCSADPGQNSRCE